MQRNHRQKCGRQERDIRSARRRTRPHRPCVIVARPRAVVAHHIGYSSTHTRSGIGVITDRRIEKERVSACLIYRSLVIFTRNVPARAGRTAERGATAEKELRLDGFSSRKTAISSLEVLTRIVWKIREPLASRFDHSRFNCPVNRSTSSSLVSREG